MSIPLPVALEDAPSVPLSHLDELWIQVGGTRCNLECRHCFISCSPHNHAFGFVRREQVRAILAEAAALGVKEYYFTGGEPFLNRELVDILELTLDYGPATVLTNGTVFRDADLSRLRAVDEDSLYSLEFRVSLDGFTAASNDPIRGDGTFARAMQGVRQLLAHDFLPIVTVAHMQEDESASDLFQGFVQLLKANGYHRPRLKILPALRIGAEAERGRPYRPEERVTREMMAGFDPGLLLCSHSRLVTDRGVFVCPILLEAPDARLGDTLSAAQAAFPLRHQACFTCYQYGTICANAPRGGDDA